MAKSSELQKIKVCGSLMNLDSVLTLGIRVMRTKATAFKENKFVNLKSCLENYQEIFKINQLLKITYNCVS